MELKNYQTRTVPAAERSNLNDVLPLRAPYVVMVDPASVCNLKCLFCPTGDLPRIKDTGRYQGLMSKEIFEKVISDLDGFPEPIKVLRLYKEGEPLLNRNFVEFVRLAKTSKKIGRIDTTTNGLSLTPELNDQLVESGINQINISINGMSDESYLRLTKKRVNTEKLFNNIIDLCSKGSRYGVEIYIKSIFENLSEWERSKFIDKFGPHAHRIFFEGLQPNWPDFHFNYVTPNYTQGHYGQKLKDREVCPFVFYMMVINADGSVSACVQDWQHELIMGDLRQSALAEIWSGDALRDLQKAHLELRKNEFHNCSICPVLRHGALDDIDNARKKILIRLAGI